MRCRIIGAPVQEGNSYPGCDMGPSSLRAAGIVSTLRQLGHDVEDLGTVVPGPILPRTHGNAAVKALAEISARTAAIAEAAFKASDEAMPIFLGGDHSMAAGTVTGVARRAAELKRPLFVLWLDAHTDFNTNALTPTGNIHGMPVACLCGHGPAQITGMSGQTPDIDPAWVRQIGIRSVDDGEKRLVHQAGLEVFDMRYLDEMGMRATMEAALAGLDADTHLHVSFDVDFLDPEIAPGVGTTVMGGPTYREAQLCMEMIADTGLMRSLDVVELNPAFDVRNKTADLAVDLIESLFGKSTLVRRGG